MAAEIGAVGAPVNKCSKSYTEYNKTNTYKVELKNENKDTTGFCLFMFNQRM